MRVFTAGVLVLALSGTASGAAPEETAAQVRAAFDGWLAAHEAQGALALVYQGGAPVVSKHGLDPEPPVELASLSKAITGVCAAELVARGTMAWDDSLEDLIEDAPDLTFAELITQSGGLRKDSTQRLMRRSFGAPWHEVAEQVLEKITERDGPKAQAGPHRYNNENYALAELMIEAATGRAYVDVCAEAALAPAGVTGVVSEDTGAFAAWGGWQMPVGDHARWHHHWFAGDNALATNPLDFPSAPLDGLPIRYGMGTYFRTLEPGNTFWHFGALCFPGRMNAGTYAVSLFGDWTIVAAYDVCIDWNAMMALDQTLTDALSGASQ